MNSLDFIAIIKKKKLAGGKKIIPLATKLTIRILRRVLPEL